MSEHHAPRSRPGAVDVDGLAVELADLDAEEAAELDALGAAIGAALSDTGPEIDADGVDSIWERVEPQS